MKAVTAQEMREIDRITVEEYGIPGIVLMERAGLAVASKVRELCHQRKAVVLCGGGNNGGDGLVVARDLYNCGYNLKVLMLAKKESLSADCRVQLQMAGKIGVPVEFPQVINDRELHGAVIVDAVLGTGLSRSVSGGLADIFAAVNRSGVPVISVDMPSGISSDTGEILGAAIKATYTVTFGLPKRGHLLYPGAAHAGRLFVEDIGFPTNLLTSDALKTGVIDRDVVSSLVRPRQRYSQKGDYGHVLVIAGSQGKTGAAFMAARSCLRSGSGLVTIGIPESLMDVFQGRVTDEMTLPLPDTGKGTLSGDAVDKILNFIDQKIDVIAIGPGIGVSADTVKIMAELVEHSPVPLVIDADGINAIEGNQAMLKSARSPLILTPHPGEMRRLIQDKGYSIADIEKDRINTALSFSRETGTCLVLKGVPTIVADSGGNAFINSTGNPGMATGGSGDVLTGIIASLLGQGLEPVLASMLGVYLHGLAGDMAARAKGEYSLIASDIIESLPDAFSSLSQ